MYVSEKCINQYTTQIVSENWKILATLRSTKANLDEINETENDAWFFLRAFVSKKDNKKCLRSLLKSLLNISNTVISYDI